MATAADVAHLIRGSRDYDDVIQRVQDARLAVVVSENSGLLVSGTVAVSQVGGNHRNVGYWIVYDIHDPEKSKVKVAGGKP